jgi:hypothetical protein
MFNWKNPNHYQFTHKLTAKQWAWEFLRRNPEYQREWHQFIATWKDLEACYGKPSQRDIKAWQRDKRAWIPEQSCAESDCRINGDKVLIECALGARWGFYKFPPDPSDHDPVSANRLVWRKIIWQAPLVGSQQSTAASLTTIAFDLSMPLPPQLEQAKRHLQIEQRKRIKSKKINAPTIAQHSQKLTRYLRILDALSVRAEIEEIGTALNSTISTIEHDKSEALALRDENYRQLLFLK